MRVLNLSTPDSTRQILDNVTKELEVVSMGMKYDARILSGEEEGVDGWVTANYLDGGLVGDEKDMIGALDWGGASSQITRMVDVGDGDRRITLYGQDYKLFTQGAMHKLVKQLKHTMLADLAHLISRYSHITFILPLR